MDINELNEIIDGAIHNVKRMGQHGRFGLSLRTLEAIKEHIKIDAGLHAIAAAPAASGGEDGPQLLMLCDDMASVATAPTKYNIRCDVESNGLKGSTNLNVIGSNQEDDGSVTVITDYWPIINPMRHFHALQQKCSDWGTYWRAPDAHGVILNHEQALELLRDALGVEVEIKGQPDLLAEPVVCPNCFWINPKPTNVVIVHNSGEKFAVPTHVSDLREFDHKPYVEDVNSSTACTLYEIKGPVR